MSIQKKGGKIKPTHLLYKSNLSHEGMKRYVNELKEKMMVVEEKNSKGKYFLITNKGLKFLQDYQRIKDFTDSFGI